MTLDETLTQGAAKALARNRHLDVCECGFPMPKYPGRYPSKCPMCDAPRDGTTKETPDGESTAAAGFPG